MQDNKQDVPELTEFKGVDPTKLIPNAITQEEANSKDFILATDINALAKLMVGWHTSVCNQGQHVLNIDNHNSADPQKIVIKVFDPDHADAVEGFRPLTDVELVPFKHGVRYMLDMVSELPFQYTPTDADNVPLPGYGANDESEKVEQTSEDSGS